MNDNFYGDDNNIHDNEIEYCEERTPVEVFFSNELENILDMYQYLNYHFPYVVNDSNTFVTCIIDYVFYNEPNVSINLLFKNKEYDDDHVTIKYIINNYFKTLNK